ncbi:serine/threonine-protein phosphatase 7 long form homolog [Rhododendron vialii]|uniref:serine/threonine-protein phosphatase 7 long form homolog n=1 Tax=Rhododendron vialii TaxID=182163 RepID=UPI00265DCDA0|nr:serine/threonine-protein phosphatase 7 long form homolog [Rhododendron vialii]
MGGDEKGRFIFVHTLSLSLPVQKKILEVKRFLPFSRARGSFSNKRKVQCKVHGQFYADKTSYLEHPMPVPKKTPNSRDYRGMEPGPIEATVLSGQKRHRSTSVWSTGSGADSTTLTVHRREAALRRMGLPDDRIIPLVQAAGFGGLFRVPFIQLDWHLITALVERWRPETHTFHMRPGEMTITLQDVSIQLGLPVDGKPVTGSINYDWDALCLNLLGATPLPGNGMGVSWGSAALGCLYRELCRASIVDKLQVVWQPYPPRVIDALLLYCRACSDIWSTSSPLICFAIIEMHQPNRVLRQFGMRQLIPSPSRSLDAPHGVDLRGGANNQAETHGASIAMWDNRRDHIVQGEAYDGVMHHDDTYKEWYQRHTRQFIGTLGCSFEKMA